MSNVLAEQAELAAQRVAPVVVEKMGITAITGILIQVFTFLSSCLNRENPGNPAGVQAAVKEENEANPEKLLRRTARRIRRIRANADEPMLKNESFALARASIEQALVMEPETAMACSTAVPNDLVVEEE